MPDGSLIPPLTHHQSGTTVEDGNRGADQTIRLTARQWAAPSVKENANTPVQRIQRIQIFSEMPPKKQKENFSKNGEKRKTINFQACASGAGVPSLDLDLFLSRLKTHQFAISCMAFQDVWNVDLERIRDCCIHIFSPDGRLIPFCMYNLTNARGQSLYRATDP